MINLTEIQTTLHWNWSRTAERGLALAAGGGALSRRGVGLGREKYSTL